MPGQVAPAPGWSVLDRSEYLAGMLATLELADPTAVRGLLERFDFFDRDRDGRLSRAAATSLLEEAAQQALAPPPPPPPPPTDGVGVGGDGNEGQYAGTVGPYDEKPSSVL